MSLFCKHVWEEKERFYKAGGKFQTAGEGGEMPVSTFEKIIGAIQERTTILYQCKKCTETHTRIIEGASQK